MPVAVGPYGQSQPSCFDRVKMGFVMGCAVGMAAGALFGTFSCLSSILVSSSGSECGVES
ncbi:ROMO1 isoform 3 [Pan troglodytes]|uniref:Reactive oxygen species modulator 1 n=3 Tax=Hominidae TaxID=9604 RepID=A0A2J8VJA9_PONAB|nr:reactive oxygen species modulator 1 [Homo sapiens]KAI4005359.1 reactive oxygen species modulator 1 [Homo sapiens]PNI27924.1 ROMO1 isoform 3 [Pan troglodytes]PNJ57602.1 ROMO1 isoform 3 [Pongo abelii]